VTTLPGRSGAAPPPEVRSATLTSWLCHRIAICGENCVATCHEIHLELTTVFPPVSGSPTLGVLRSGLPRPSRRWLWCGRRCTRCIDEACRRTSRRTRIPHGCAEPSCACLTSSGTIGEAHAVVSGAAAQDLGMAATATVVAIDRSRRSVHVSARCSSIERRRR
jgi:hypothetical protein